MGLLVSCNRTCSLVVCSWAGNLAYSYMKRGQVLLAEHWAREHPNLKVVSSHPGWASTEGVDKAFGESKSLLDPMRTAWEGAEGICWLFACDLDKIVPGASVVRHGKLSRWALIVCAARAEPSRAERLWQAHSIWTASRRRST